jgi:hypothetical protein
LNTLENRFARSHPTTPVIATGGAMATGALVRTNASSRLA